MDSVDREIINQLQGGFPLCDRPYLVVAKRLGITEEALILRIGQMLENKVLTRFGPMYQIERMGGAFSLAAMCVPEHDFERVAAIVNALPAIAHNYERQHEFNMWFVLATEKPEGIADAIAKIEADTGYQVFDMPKVREYFVGLRLVA